MNLLQRFYRSVIDASDAFGASLAGVDVQTYREQTYGHPDGVVAAQRVAHSLQAAVRQAEPVDRDEADLSFGMFGSAPHAIAVCSVNPSVRAHAFDREDEP